MARVWTKVFTAYRLEQTQQLNSLQCVRIETAGADGFLGASLATFGALKSVKNFKFVGVVDGDDYPTLPSVTTNITELSLQDCSLFLETLVSFVGRFSYLQQFAYTGNGSLPPTFARTVFQSNLGGVIPDSGPFEGFPRRSVCGRS